MKQEFFGVMSGSDKTNLLVEILTRNFDEMEAEIKRQIEEDGIEEPIGDSLIPSISFSPDFNVRCLVRPPQVLVFVQTKRDSDK